MKNKNLKESKGITLIALVITIIVLLILAAVGIATLTGENGILNRAADAKNKTDEASEKEKIEFALIGAEEFENGNMVLNSEKFKEELYKEFMDKEITLDEFGNNTYLLSISKNDVKRDYFIDENKKIIKGNNILIINSKDTLKKFRDDVNIGNNYENRDIICSQDIELDSNEEWIPIGNSEENSFKGNFNGNNHSISGIKISNEGTCGGFFGFNKGTIKNLTLSKNNSISGNIAVLGGVVATNFNNIENCKNDATINGKLWVSGICAVNKGGNILNCINNGEINATNEGIGGIAGSNEGKIENCKNTGNITTNQYYGGGICGSNYGNIRKCCNSGNVKGNGEIHYTGTGSMTMVGGIVGQFVKNTIEFCYNSGNVWSKWNQAGGIVGNCGVCNIYNCYNYGTITSEIKTEVGSICGYIESSAKLLNCYYLEGTNGCGYDYISDELIEKKVDEMTSENFINELNKGEKAFIFDTNKINNGYPILNWQIKN